MKKNKTHIRDIRLYNNAGISFPVCRAGAEMLDLDCTRYEMANPETAATCLRCPDAYKKRYPWTQTK